MCYPVCCMNLQTKKFIIFYHIYIITCFIGNSFFGLFCQNVRYVSLHLGCAVM